MRDSTISKRNRAILLQCLLRGFTLMTRLSKIKEKRDETAVLFNNQCTICLKKYGKNFHFHHVYYVEGQKKHSDFKSALDYNEYILPVIADNTAQFELLCRTCHRLLTIMQMIKDNARFERLIELTKRSRYGLCTECGSLHPFHKSECSEVAYHPCQ